MAEQTESRDVGHRVYSARTRKRLPRQIELRGQLDHRTIAALLQEPFLKCRRKDSNAERLAEDNDVARMRTAVALDEERIDDARDREAIDRFHRIDAVATGHGNTGLPANRLAAPQNVPDRLLRQYVDGHAENRQG